VKSSKQLPEHKGTHPCVVVLHNTTAIGVHLLDLWARAAMFGKAQIEVPIDRDDGAPLPEPRILHERSSRKLTRDANTTISAVALLERIRPNQHLVSEHLRQLALTDTHAIVHARYAFCEAHWANGVATPRRWTFALPPSSEPLRHSTRDQRQVTRDHTLARSRLTFQNALEDVAN
jgi:hypothetical protein